MTTDSTRNPRRCPFANRPDVTGCDCDCELPDAGGNGFWARVRRFFSPRVCVSGYGGCGDGSLPCERYDRWRRYSRGEAGNG